MIRNGNLDKKLNLDIDDNSDYDNIKNKYKIENNDSIGKIKFKIWQHFENLIDPHVGQIVS